MPTSFLPRLLKWVFRVLSVLMGIAAVAIVVTLLINPSLPGDTTVGPVKIELFGQPGVLWLQNATFSAQYLMNHSVNVRLNNAAGLFEVVKHTGLPVALLGVVYFGLLFELLRRLFANVQHGLSFTRQSLRLVQVIGVSLLVFSVVSATAEDWFQYEVFRYLSQHAVLEISGNALHAPAQGDFRMDMGNGFPFGNSLFFTGLMVLALSEVFRQGLKLKSENDLTI